jgi:phosphoribosyl-dephospho-CoA transferase
VGVGGVKALVDLWPHHLVQIDPEAILVEEGDSWPVWAGASLAAAPWAVVRHGRPVPGFVAVGIRGPGRAARWGTEVSMSGVLEVRAPESLRNCEAWDSLPDVAAVRSLRAVADDLNGAELCWGPAGSVGFSIATGWIVCNDASDLDIVVRCTMRPQPGTLEYLASLLSRQEARVDCQVVMPAGTAHLDDLIGDEPALVRTSDGPNFCVDPWSGEQP